MPALLKFMNNHRLWVYTFGASCLIGLTAAIFNLNENYLYVAIAAQLGLAPLYCVTALISFYLNDLFFRRRRFAISLGMTVALVTLSSALAEWISPYTREDLQPISFSLHVIGIIFLLILATYLRSVKEFLKRKLEFEQFQVRQMEAELKLIKQQLNPHFLFNTLNSIYLKATKNSEETAEMILSLSDLLHYQLRTETALQISLEEEIKFLENYIYFEKRRLPETMQVVFNQSVDKTKRIAPNLLMPVIENAFKHGVLIQAVGAITIDLRQTNGILQLNTMNPIAVAPHHHSGIGLANLRKRLDFLYGKKYKLELERKEQIFYASLQLQL